MSFAGTLVAPQQLAASRGHVVFDCRFSLLDPNAGRNAFAAGHIPGAYRLDMETDLAGRKSGHNGRHPLPSLRDMERVLRQAGVDAATPIVLYDQQRLAGAARAWWLLRYFGVPHVHILDGGLSCWTAAGLQLERGQPATSERPGNIKLATQPTTKVIDLDAMRNEVQAGATHLVDAREPERFHGYRESIDPVAGRIPGAVNLPWTKVTDDNGRVRPAAELSDLWKALDVGSDPIVYCGSGVTACVLLLARDLAGLAPAQLYAGGFSEWCQDPDNPIGTDQADC